MKDVSDIRITDPYVKHKVKEEQARSGEKTATKTASRLILERVAQKEMAPPTVDLERSAEPTAA